MNSRRSFIKKITGGVAFSAAAFSSSSALASELASIQGPMQKRIRIGIIGAENSHTAALGKLFNIDKKFPGVEVLYVWGETDEFAQAAAKGGKIPNIVKDPKEMMGKIDALVVDHRHAKYHLEAATPFVKAKIPTFVDKPFCYRVEEGKKFLAMAREIGTPVTSFSSLTQMAGTADMKKQVQAMGKITQVIWAGPVDLDSPWGGVFFYGIHIVEPMMHVFGEDVERVRVTRNGKDGTANVIFKSGLAATLIFKNASRSRETYVETKDGLVELKSTVQEPDPEQGYKDIVEMFRTGKEPRSHDSILNTIAVLEALEKSSVTGQWEWVGV
ncbi:MAG: Gfo/Idh/MocA family oxidoreductase [Chitinophagaceae bacterium]|nr:Gfo/Idh/MocA family oxidoreductase [Chitinophagaceae bacterium]